MSTAQMITSIPQSDASLSGPLSEAIDQLLACAASCAIETAARSGDRWGV
jgi:hypothetical protein